MPKPYADDIQDTVDQSQDTLTNVKNKVTEGANKAKDKAEEIGRNVQTRIDETRAPAADKLQTAASTLHEKADNLPGGQTVAGLAHKTADTMQATAEYVRQHDVQDMMSDVESFVRRHPGQSLLAAAAVGFLVGRSFRSDD